MIEEKVLTDIGLSEIEAKIYIASLELGSDSVLQIAKKADVKRPTAYVVLDSLIAKGFVTKIDKGTTTHFAAEDPSIVINAYKQKLANFSEMIPLFRAKYNRGPKPKIRFYEGREALWDVYTNVLYPCPTQYFFGVDVAKLEAQLPGMMEYWETKVHPKVKDYKEIVADNAVGLAHQKRMKKYGTIKVMPPDLPVYSDAMISDDKVFIVSLDNLFGVLVESEDIAKTFKNFFLLAWQAAK